MKWRHYTLSLSYYTSSLISLFTCIIMMLSYHTIWHHAFLRLCSCRHHRLNQYYQLYQRPMLYALCFMLYAAICYLCPSCNPTVNGCDCVDEYPREWSQGWCSLVMERVSIITIRSYAYGCTCWLFIYTIKANHMYVTITTATNIIILTLTNDW